MSTIEACAVPESSLLARYTRAGAYTDCYTTVIARSVTHAEFVEAFYTGAVFRLERLILAWFLSRPSTDADVKALAAGTSSKFAAWTVEGRSRDQLLLCDMHGRTRSWLMVEPIDSQPSPSTRLYFGSAVVPVRDKATGKQRMGMVFTLLLGFHRIYSRVLLGAARSRLARSAGNSRTG